MWMEMCRCWMAIMTRRRRISSWVQVVAMVVVCLAVGAAQIKVASATGTEELGDVGEYWQKRSQESRLRNRGGPLHDLVAAATRFHQGLLDHRTGRRYLLAEEGSSSSSSDAAADAPSSSSSSSSSAPSSSTTTTGSSAAHNTLADHDIVGA